MIVIFGASENFTIFPKVRFDWKKINSEIYLAGSIRIIKGI